MFHSTGKLILGNLLRRPLRNGLTIAGVALASAALFSLVSFQRGYQAGLHGEMDRLGAHVLVVPKGCPYDAASIALHGANWPCYLKSDYVETVRTTPHVAVAAPVFMAAIYQGDTGSQVVYCGVEPDIARLKSYWKVEGRMPTRPGDLLIGSEVARTRGWRMGQSVSLPGVESGSGTVAGIIGATQGADDLFIFMPMADAQRTFKHPGEITHMLVKLDDPSNLENVVGALKGCGVGLEMNIVPLAHLFRTIENLLESTRLLLGSIALVGLIVAATGVSNTVLMAVAERTREMGVMRAIGASRGHIFGMIWLETFALCLTGSVAGIVLAILGGKTTKAWLRGRIPFAPSGDLLRPEAIVAGGCVLVMIVIGTIAGLLPAYRAASLSPVAAMKSQGEYA